MSSTPDWKQAKRPGSSHTPQPASYAWYHPMEKDKEGPCLGLIKWNSVPGQEKWVIRIILAIAGFVALSRAKSKWFGSMDSPLHHSCVTPGTSNADGIIC